MGVGRRRRGWTRRILRRGEVGGVRKAALFLSPFKLVCADIVNMTLLSPSSLLSIPRDNEEEEEEEEGRASISSSRRRRRRRQMRVGECTHSWSEEGGLDFSLVGRKPHTLAVAQIREGVTALLLPVSIQSPLLFLQPLAVIRPSFCRHRTYIPTFVRRMQSRGRAGFYYCTGRRAHVMRERLERSVTLTAVQYMSLL